jgi:hypothetical protein
VKSPDIKIGDLAKIKDNLVEEYYDTPMWLTVGIVTGIEYSRYDSAMVAEVLTSGGQTRLFRADDLEVVNHAEAENAT